MSGVGLKSPVWPQREGRKVGPGRPVQGHGPWQPRHLEPRGVLGPPMLIEPLCYLHLWPAGLFLRGLAASEGGFLEGVVTGLGFGGRSRVAAYLGRWSVFSNSTQLFDQLGSPDSSSAASPPSEHGGGIQPVNWA